MDERETELIGEQSGVLPCVLWCSIGRGAAFISFIVSFRIFTAQLGSNVILFLMPLKIET